MPAKKLTGLFISLISLSSYSQQKTIKEIFIDSAVIKMLFIKGYPDFLATDGDNMWVLNENRVEKYTVAKDSPVLSVSITEACGAMIVYENSLWVTNCKEQTIYRVDKYTGKILAVIKTGIADRSGEISLAAGSGSIWVLSDSKGVLTRIDTKNNSIKATIKVLPNSFCAVFGYGAVWITNTFNNSVQRINPATNKVVATISTGQKPRFLAFGENGVWTLNQQDGTVTHIDPVTNKVKATIETKVPYTGGDIAAGGGYVWVRSAKERLLQTIDPSTDKVKSIYVPVAGSGAVRVSSHHVWITAHDVNKLWIMPLSKQ